METSAFCPYRSVKSAARGMARSLHAGENLSDETIAHSESLHTFDPEKDAQYPRAIETKGLRFAITAKLIDQMADIALVGEGSDTRIPQIKSVKPREARYYDNDKTLVLFDDWIDMDMTESIKAVIDDPDNYEVLSLYRDIVEDISTDPEAETDYNSLDTDDALDILYTRLNPSKSFETVVGMTFLIKMLQKLAAKHPLSPEQCRLIGIQNIELFSRLAQLESAHSELYINHFNVQDIGVLTQDEIGIEFNQVDGAWKLALKTRHKKPDVTFGPPVGCPAGFDLESRPSRASELSEDTSLHRFATAYLNEAYDRGLFDVA